MGVPVNENKNDQWKNNRFVRIKILADRVRQLELGAPPMVDKEGKTMMETAIAEFEEGKIYITSMPMPIPTPSSSKKAGKEKESL